MEKIEQENSQEVQQNNFLEGKMPIQTTASGQSIEAEGPIEPKVTQLVPPQEALNKIAELECQYRETVERENK